MPKRRVKPFLNQPFLSIILVVAVTVVFSYSYFYYQSWSFNQKYTKANQGFADLQERERNYPVAETPEESVIEGEVIENDDGTRTYIDRVAGFSLTRKKE